MTTPQISPDSSMGTIVEQNGDNFSIQGGTIQDNHLFHSFVELNILFGQSAYFENPAGVTQIFSRVTGENFSYIDGLFGVRGGADLHLINPNGIFFGRNASLDIEGSFFASTGGSFTIAPIANSGNNSSTALIQINIQPGLQDAPPNSFIISRGNLSVGGDISLAAPFIDLQGDIRAGGNINISGWDVLISDRPDKPTTLTSRQVNIDGDRIQILLVNHPNSGIFTSDAISIIAVEDIHIEGEIGVAGKDDLEALDVEERTGIAIESDESIQLKNAILNVFREYSSVILAAPVVEILARSEILAEEIEINANSLEVSEKSQLIAIAFDEESWGEIEVNAKKQVTVDNSRLILQTLKGTIVIDASERISFRNKSAVLSQTRSGNTEPQMSFRTSIFLLENSTIAAKNPSAESIADIHLDISKSVILRDGASIVGQGDVDIVTEVLSVSPDSAIESVLGGEVNIEILPTPLPAQIEESLRIEIPLLPVTFPAIENPVTEIITPPEDFEITPLDGEGDRETSTENSCVTKDEDTGLYILHPQGTASTPDRPIATPASFFVGESFQSSVSSSLRDQKADGIYDLIDGGQIISSLCSR